MQDDESRVHETVNAYITKTKLQFCAVRRV